VTNRYDELSERARFFLENWDEIDLAEICASGDRESATLKAKLDRVREIADELIAGGACWDGNEPSAGRRILAALADTDPEPPLTTV
jgi:hypothetical protein